MNVATANSDVRGLRLWPGIVAVALYWALTKIPGWIWPGEMIHLQFMMFGGMITQVLFLVWWMFFSRAPWRDRFALLIACVIIGVAANFLAHESYRGMFFMMFMPPIAMTAWVGWLFVSQRLSWSTQRAGLIVAFLIAFGWADFFRHEGVDGYFNEKRFVRWTESTEQKFLARSSQKPAVQNAPAESVKPLEMQAGDWAEFRGKDRDSRLTGTKIDTDWKKNPPRELWRHDVGPGWSSFCVIGDHVFTQEQHGDEEAVVCYHAYTGNVIWQHRVHDRFWEAVGGAGPRATPTFHEGKLYTMGARGRLNCFDAATGKVIWSRNIVDDTKAAIPDWGFSASPLVVKGLMTVFSGGPDKKTLDKDAGVQNKSIQAYRADTGEKAWESGNSKLSYCSVHRATLGGIEQLLFVGGDGLTSFDPASGKQLWFYEWDMGEGFNRCTQPAVISDTDVLIGSGFGQGTHRVHVTRDGDNWKAEKVWASRSISPYYNDLVIYKDHAYGFDTNGFLTCVDLEKGGRKWKERGYDNGQVLLLADQGVLLVQCEKGDVALVEARPDKHLEIARIKGLVSKTWNHPVIANGKLFIRNDQEAVCFELKPMGN